MENIWLVALLLLIGWHILATRKDISNRNISTTLFLSIDSDENDGYGLPIKSFHLIKKTNISFAIVPGMELVEPGEAMSLQVARVVFEDFQDNARGVHLESKHIPLSQLERRVDAYLKSGWQNHG